MQYKIIEMKLILTSIFILFSIIGYTQKDKKITEKTVTPEQIRAHIQFLASDAMKGRDTPSPEQRIAAEYLRNQLLLFGVKPFPEFPDYLQAVSMQKESSPTVGKVLFDSSTFLINDDFLLLNGDNINWRGNFILMDYAMPDEIASSDVKGKIIVAKAGSRDVQSPRQWFSLGREKRKAAEEAGAKGLIELYNSAQLPWSILTRYFSGERVGLVDPNSEAPYTHVLINNSNNTALKEIENKEQLSLVIEGKKTEKFESYNVVGWVEGTKKPEEFVVYSAHYDHVGVGTPDSTGDGIYNGARDNAVGSVTVLSMAENLAKFPTERSGLFIFFTGEEKGLLGSEWYVENSPVSLDQIIYCFNSDGAGYNDTSKATIIGLTRTSAEEKIREACTAFDIEAIEDQMPEQNLFDRSDNVNFAKKGIPAPTFSMGVTAFDAEILKYYHQPADGPETLDYDYLYKFFRAYVYAGRLIGNMAEKPFWNEGDKYYDAGIQLYKTK